jgi:dipeptidyl aminopeptidase/acylaminoacyl peptidase
MPNPTTGDYGVVDCAAEPGPYYDRPETTFAAGVGGTSGDNPCGEGGRGDGKGGDGGSLPTLRIVRVIEVTDGKTEYMQPTWSPDGTKLAFTKPTFKGIYVANSDGSGPVRELTAADYSGYKPTWTSDSKGIVVRRRTGVVRQAISYIDVSTGTVKDLEDAAHPGQPERNAYGDIAVDVNGEGKILNEATGGLETKRAYYSKERPASEDLRLERDSSRSGRWVIVDGDGARRMAFPHPALLASLSPTHGRVAFLRGDGNLYVSGFDGSGAVRLGPGSADWNWSLDGERLVYVGDEEDNGYTTTASELFVWSWDGRVTQLTDTPGIAEIFPCWSPDGTRIAYSTHGTGKICVAVLEETR